MSTPRLAEIEIPAIVPVMTLSDAVLFPQALMPLHIFEPRYRVMLQDVLQQDRIFAIATLDPTDHSDFALANPPYKYASAAVVRACVENANGSSNLIIQGIARIKLEQIVSETPYRKALVEQVYSEVGGTESALQKIQPALLSLINTQRKLGAKIPREVVQFLAAVSTPEELLDLAIHALCPTTALRLELLQTRGVVPRYQQFCSYLKREIERLKLERTLRDGLDDTQIGLN